MAEQKARQHPIKTVGVVGLGGVGGAICRRFAKEGQQSGISKVVAFDKDPSALAALGATGVVAAKSIAHLVDMSDLVLLCLPGSVDVGKIARSHEGLLDCVRQGQTIVDHSWSSFDLTRQLATAFSARGAAFLDAPIGKSADIDRVIEAGRLAFAIGGEATVVDAVSSPLGCFAGDITRVGPAGTAQVVRQMSDLVTLQTFAALGEALATARAFGVEGDRLFNALAKGNGDGIGRHGLADLLGNDETAAKGETSIAEAGRRLKEAIELANRKKLSLTGAGGTLSLLEQAMENGMGEKDLSGLFGTMEAESESAPPAGRMHG